MHVNLPYVVSYRSRAKLFHYLRRKGHPNIRLEGEPGTPEFLASYQTALAMAPQPRHGHGTIGGLVLDFYAGAAFSNLKPASQRVYRLVFDGLAATDGHRTVKGLTPDFARRMIEAIGATRPAMANLTTKALRRLMAYAVKLKLRSDNPFAGMTEYKGGTHHTWTDAELKAYESRWPLGTRERLAYALLLYTDQRGGDVVKMNRRAVFGGAIHVVQEKTGTPLVIPIHRDLAAALKAGPSNGINLIGDPNGRSISRSALTELIKRAARAAGLSSHCLPHGLRKAMLRRLAERGATAKELQAISGHRTLEEVERYTAAADQQKLAKAAIRRLKK